MQRKFLCDRDSVRRTVLQVLRCYCVVVERSVGACRGASHTDLLISLSLSLSLFLFSFSLFLVSGSQAEMEVLDECRERQQDELEALVGVYDLQPGDYSSSYDSSTSSEDKDKDGNGNGNGETKENRKEGGKGGGGGGAQQENHVVNVKLSLDDLNGDRGNGNDEDLSTVTLSFIVPALYPLEAGATLSNVVAPCAAAKAKDAGTEALQSGAPSLEKEEEGEGEGEGTRTIPGVESLFSACEAVLEVVREARETLACERREASHKRVTSSRSEEAQHKQQQHAHHNCVVHIDHMNDRSKYLKHLQRWSKPFASCSGGVRVFYLVSPSVTKRRPKGAENCFVCLSGPPEAISLFLSRLRTEYVDVEGKDGKSGTKCKERCSKVLANRRPGDLKVGEQQVPNFTGFCAEEYNTEEQLEEKLQRLNLLHCGDGRERFFAKNT